MTISEALAAHEEVLRRFGGRQGVLNRGSLESAIARPYSGYHRPIARKAAALVEAIACNHAFVDGNKRTAIMMLGILLWKSGYALQFKMSEKRANKAMEDMVVALVKHEIAFEDVVNWIKARLTKRQS